MDTLDAVADRGYFDSEEILACEESGITVTVPKPLTSGAKAEGRFGKQGFDSLSDLCAQAPLHDRPRAPNLALAA
jgi:transposase